MGLNQNGLHGVFFYAVLALRVLERRRVFARGWTGLY